MGAVEPDATLREELREGAMQDGGAELALDVVADQRQAALLEAAAPAGVGGDEDRDAVHEGAAGLQAGLGVELGGRLRADRQPGDQDLRARPPQHVGDVGDRRIGLRDLAGEVAAEPVERRAAAHHHAALRHLREDLRVVRRREDRLRQVLPDLARGDVEGGGQHDVLRPVPAERGMRQSGAGFARIAVEGQALHEGGSAVADAGDADAQRAGARSAGQVPTLPDCAATSAP